MLMPVIQWARKWLPVSRRRYDELLVKYVQARITAELWRQLASSKPPEQTVRDYLRADPRRN